MAKEYTVLKITELTRLSAAGGLEKYYRHTVQTRGKITITVDVDESQFSADKAGPILMAAAVNADKILSL